MGFAECCRKEGRGRGRSVNGERATRLFLRVSEAPLVPPKINLTRIAVKDTFESSFTNPGMSRGLVMR